MRQSLILQLNRLAVERWSRRALRTVLRSAWLALCIWCIWVGFSLFRGTTPDLILGSLLGLTVLAAGMISLALDRRLTPDAVARRLDRRFKLQEQLSTAVEIAGKNIDPESINGMLLDQSSQTIRQVRRRIVQHQRGPWSDLIALIALAFAAAGLFILAGIGRPPLFSEPAPLPPLVGDTSQLPEEAFDPPPDSQTIAGSSGDGSSVTDLENPNGSPGQAGQSGQPGTQAGQNGQQAGQAGQPQQGTSNTSSQPRDAAAQRNIDSIADALRDQGVTRPAAEALDRGDLDSAAQSLRELADQAGQLSEQTRESLAESLRDAASDIQPSNPELAQQLRESARGIERGNENAAQGLDDLARAIEEQAGDPQQGDQAGQPGQQPGSEAGQQGDQAGQMPGSSGQEGQGDGSQPGSGGGAGDVGAGDTRAIENNERLGVDGQPVTLDVPAAEGGAPNGASNQATADGVSAVGSTAGGGGSASSGGSGPDPLRVPMDERDVVQDYFTP
jgi:hypothetical protein